jgi:hypothetical protein
LQMCLRGYIDHRSKKGYRGDGRLLEGQGREVTSIDQATDHCAAEIRAGRLCTAADLVRLFGITPPTAESCRRMAEDAVSAENAHNRVRMSVQPRKGTQPSAERQALEKADRQAKSLPRAAWQR